MPQGGFVLRVSELSDLLLLSLSIVFLRMGMLPAFPSPRETRKLLWDPSGRENFQSAVHVLLPLTLPSAGPLFLGNMNG